MRNRLALAIWTPQRYAFDQEGRSGMSFLRGFLPRPVRRAIHPVRSTVGSVKRRATPKPIRKAQYARHRVGTATTHTGRTVRRSFTK